MRVSENNGRADTAASGTSSSASAPVSPRTTGRSRGTSGKHDRKAGSRAAARKNPRSRLARVALLVAWLVLSTAVAAGHGVLDDGVQRDLHSAFLARFVVENTLDARIAALAFPGAKPLLRRAAPERAARTREQGCVRAGPPSKIVDLVREAGDVVAERRGLRRTQARPGLLPSLRLSEPPGSIPGEV